LGTFWLKIEQIWPFEEISIFSIGGPLGYRTALTDTFLKGDHPRIILEKFKILMKESLDGSLPNMCPAVRPFDQDAPHSRT
jgi:hypothetical protein